MGDKLPDIRSAGFAEWCDYVARDRCVRMKDDPKLIGYFFTDCPTWIHSQSGNQWKAPILDPELEKTESGRKEIFDTASIYYKTITEAIRRYDPNHLICGDRYEANAPISESVLKALRNIPECLGFHLCGAYIKNNARRYGLLDLHENEEPTTQGIKKVNFEQAEWARSHLK